MSLRKAKLDEFISHKRKINVGDKNQDLTRLEIKLDLLNVDEKYKSFKYKDDESFYEEVKMLLTSEELDMIKLGLYLLRTQISVAQPIPALMFLRDGYVELLLDLMNNLLTDPIIVVK